MRASVTTCGLLLLLCGCGDEPGESPPDPHIWTATSVGIDYELRGAVGQHICSASLQRGELSEAELAQLAALTLIDGDLRAGCDIDNYVIHVRDADGSSVEYRAWEPVCTDASLILFSDFNEWASAHGCSR
jgi:hypothetical protein